MNKIDLHILLLIAVLAIFCIVIGCTNTMVAERTFVEGTGVLNLPDMFGSPLKITGNDGLVYIPSQFPHDHFNNGDKVAYSGHTTPNPYYPVQTGVQVDLILMRQIPGDSGFIYGIGNVTYIPIEGGFYGIVVDTGGKSGVVKFLPLDLDREFSQDGIVVSFTAKGRPDAVTTTQWGLPVNIVRMKKLL
jgi:hypothetical protein